MVKGQRAHWGSCGCSNTHIAADCAVTKSLAEWYPLGEKADTVAAAPTSSAPVRTSTGNTTKRGTA